MKWTCISCGRKGSGKRPKSGRCVICWLREELNEEPFINERGQLDVRQIKTP